jgi:hypothetical protein
MEKLGPTQFQAEVARLRAAGKMPSQEEVLKAVADSREKYRSQILQARKEGHNGKNGE